MGAAIYQQQPLDEKMIVCKWRTDENSCWAKAQHTILISMISVHFLFMLRKLRV